MECPVRSCDLSPCDSFSFLRSEKPRTESNGEIERAVNDTMRSDVRESWTSIQNFNECTPQFRVYLGGHRAPRCYFSHSYRRFYWIKNIKIINFEKNVFVLLRFRIRRHAPDALYNPPLLTRTYTNIHYKPSHYPIPRTMAIFSGRTVRDRRAVQCFSSARRYNVRTNNSRCAKNITNNTTTCHNGSMGFVLNRLHNVYI